MSKRELPPSGHAFSGALGAALALLITYPLDIVKTRSQVSLPPPFLEKDPMLFSMQDRRSAFYLAFIDPFVRIHKSIHKIVAKEGVQGLYTGLPVSVIGCVSSNFAYFYYYFYIKRAFLRQFSSKKPSAFVDLVLSAMAGILSQLTTLPASVVITRQQTAPLEARLSISETCSSIFQSSGLAGFWKGLQPSLILVMNPAITYGFFEPIKHWLLRGQQRALKSWEVFLVGALAKTLATVVTYPYIMAKTRLQWKPPERTSNQLTPLLQFSTASEVLVHAYRTEGLKGWYKGMQLQIIKAVLSQALLFMLKDKLDNYTLLIMKSLRTNIKTSASKSN